MHMHNWDSQMRTNKHCNVLNQDPDSQGLMQLTELRINFVILPICKLHHPHVETEDIKLGNRVGSGINL